MLQVRSILDVADNTGARTIECIRVMGRSLKTTAGVGDVIIASVKQAIPNAACLVYKVVTGPYDPVHMPRVSSALGARRRRSAGSTSCCSSPPASSSSTAPGGRPPRAPGRRPG